jgi:hypothetical protein
MPDLREQLLTELIELRQGVGLNRKRVEEKPVLFERLGGGAAGEPAELLLEFVRMISDPLQRKAVAWAFALTGTKKRTFTERLEDLATELGRSTQTARRLTDKGLDDLAGVILKYSPEGSDEVSVSQRIADLELTVSMLGRIIFSLTHEARAYEREKVDRSIQADSEEYVRSFTRILWRGSENGRPAIVMFWSELSFDLNLDVPGIDPAELDNYILGPPPDPLEGFVA